MQMGSARSRVGHSASLTPQQPAGPPPQQLLELRDGGDEDDEEGSVIEAWAASVGGREGDKHADHLAVAQSDEAAAQTENLQYSPILGQQTAWC